MAGNSYSYLPEHMIRDILLRLPVKSLLRFDALSKHWFAQITSYNFINTHHQHPSNPKLSVALRGVYGHSSCRISVLRGGRNTTDEYHMPFMTDACKSSAKIVGSAKGLLCLFMEWINLYVLWNPATRQCRELPSPPANSVHASVSGFGFHHHIKDYKVFQITDCGVGPEDRTGKVFTFGTDSWKEVRDHIPIYDYDPDLSKPVLVEGVWYVTVKYQETPFILTFDMGNDTFSKVEIVLPYNDLADHNKFRMDLMVYKESPAIFCRYQQASDFEFSIWALKDQSWAKLFICNAKFPPNCNSLRHSGCWFDEEYLFVGCDMFFKSKEGDVEVECLFFNPFTEELKRIDQRQCWYRGQVHSYVQSLVSVYSTKCQDVVVEALS